MGWIILGIVVGIVVLVALYVLGVYNRLIVLKNHVDEAFSTMDVFLKKRFDMIPNLVETAKGYVKHEKETLENVTKARTSIMNASTPNERIAGEQQLSGALKTLFAVAENYPDLKANTSFLELSQSIRGMEKEIADSRRYYNGTVKAFNTKRELFPASVVANAFKFEKRTLFELDSAEERKNVKVEF